MHSLSKQQQTQQTQEALAAYRQRRTNARQAVVHRQGIKKDWVRYTEAEVATWWWEEEDTLPEDPSSTETTLSLYEWLAPSVEPMIRAQLQMDDEEDESLEDFLCDLRGVISDKEDFLWSIEMREIQEENALYDFVAGADCDSGVWVLMRLSEWSLLEILALCTHPFYPF